MDTETTSARAFEFGGNWREFAPIAFTNLLLTVVTLGIYSSWAKARERRYLWNQTRFIDDRLEWTGTGLELFIGYVLAIVLFGIPLAGINFVIQALAMQGHNGAAVLIVLGLYLLLFYLVGVAVFRALRYRLSRTYWHGIRGGSDDQGLAYGFSHLWKSIVGSLAFGLLVPWSLVSLWKERWGAMSFGPHRFEAGGSSGPLMGRYLLYYLLPIILVVGGVIIGAFFRPDLGSTPEEIQSSLMTMFVVGYLVFFVLLGLVALIFYAAYFREVVSNLSLGGLEFGFTARTTDWFKLMLGNFALVVCTLGIGAIFVGYRNWSFFVGHMHAYGTLSLDDFTQSTTRAPGQGEGLLDAFDVGAI
jgi:uncharacterized membrane protein YjgN (DUF898 family)